MPENSGNLHIDVTEDEPIRKYEAALSLKFYEGQISWQMNILFVALNVGLGSVIQGRLDKIQNHDGILIVMSFVGLVINFFWLGTFLRNNRYYHFRMAQAKAAEPKDWHLLREQGYRFSKGREVIIEDEGIAQKDTIHQLSPLEKIASNKNAILIAILLFMGCYGGLITFWLWVK